MATQSLVYIALDGHIESLERIDVEPSKASHLLWLYVPHIARDEANHLIGSHLELAHPGGGLASGVFYGCSLLRAFVLMMCRVGVLWHEVSDTILYVCILVRKEGVLCWAWLHLALTQRVTERTVGL